jgi:hypothetical protein
VWPFFFHGPLDIDDETVMRSIVITIVLASWLLMPEIASAGPPSYLLLRQPESPGPKGHPGQPAAAYYDVRTNGYAYGYFGVGPRSHWSRSYGVLRVHKQWSQW